MSWRRRLLTQMMMTQLLSSQGTFLSQGCVLHHAHMYDQRMDNVREGLLWGMHSEAHCPALKAIYNDL